MARRILLLITDLQIGGTPTVVRELAIHLREAGADVEVACLAKWGPVADQLRSAGVPTTALNAWNTADMRVVGRLVHLLRQGGFDTVFSFLVHANAVAAAASAFRADIRYIQSIQTTQPYPRWHWRLQHLIHPAAERIVVPSPSVAEAAHRWSAIPHSRIVIIPNAVETAAFANLAHPGKEACPFPIGFIGRLDPIKRIPDLLEAAATLRGHVHLHLFGEGSQRAFIESEIARLGINAMVTLHGAIARPQEALARIGLLVLPSQAEGFGLVLIEAMAAGIPVIATDVPGIRDVVRPGQTGLLIPPASPDRLAGAIATMIDNASLRQRLADHAIADVEQRFSWPSIIRQYQSALGLPIQSQEQPGEFSSER